MSNISVTIIIIPNIKINLVVLKFILDLFDLKNAEIEEKKYKHAMIAVHHASITEKSQLVQLLSSGCMSTLSKFMMF